LLDLLLDRLMPSRHAEFLWELIRSQSMQFWITNDALEKVWRYIDYLQMSSNGKTIAKLLMQILNRCDIRSEMMQKAIGMESELPYAIQIAAAEYYELEGIVSNKPLNYCRADIDTVMLFSPLELLSAQHDDSHYFKKEIHSQRRILETQFSDLVIPNDQVYCDHQAVRLESIKVCCGHARPTARVKIQTPSGRTHQELASGVGPVDAAYRALNQAVNRFILIPELRVICYDTRASQIDGEAYVSIMLECDDSLFPGHSSHVDIVMASVYAYMDALQYIYQRDVNRV
ncbi:MAG: alpha-isopropylmalate synthase regulatory domain-containing protein, partial [Cyanobacteria bacterium P01_D01_bin.44]